MSEEMTNLVRKYPELFNELEARETVIRMNFDTEQRRGKFPFCSQYRFEEREDIILPLLVSLESGEVDQVYALKVLTDLLNAYYEDNSI